MMRNQVSAPSLSPHLLHHLARLRRRFIAVKLDKEMGGAVNVEVGKSVPCARHEAKRRAAWQ
jgi:hypothetical protein